MMAFCGVHPDGCPVSPEEELEQAQAENARLKVALRTVCDDFEHCQERFSTPTYGLIHAAQIARAALAEEEVADDNQG